MGIDYTYEVLYKNRIYRTLNSGLVKSADFRSAELYDLAVIPPGFKIARGDTDDIYVANHYEWGHRSLIFSTGVKTATKINTDTTLIGTTRGKNLLEKSGEVQPPSSGIFSLFGLSSAQESTSVRFRSKGPRMDILIYRELSPDQLQSLLFDLSSLQVLRMDIAQAESLRRGYNPDPASLSIMGIHSDEGIDWSREFIPALLPEHLRDDIFLLEEDDNDISVYMANLAI
jgi:hypothetical protein